MNVQCFSWSPFKAGAPQGLILGPLLFLIYKNDLCEKLASNPKLFADHTTLLSIVHNVTSVPEDLNNELNKTNNWAFQWKMGFNPH